MQRFDAEDSVQFTPEELQLIGGNKFNAAKIVCLLNDIL